MEIYVVTSDTGQVMGAFTTEEKAKSCISYFKSSFPENVFYDYLEYIDLIDYDRLK